MEKAIRNFGLSAERVFTDYRACLERTKPDLVLLCPATAQHGEWTAKVASFGVHVIVEKPFAASLAEADAMVAAMQKGKLLAINWPLRWEAAAVTAKRIVDDGIIGEPRGFHHYGG